ncbi:hypothetical protein CTAM01_13915 [Colletotrichum tamarilloi]|uniref:Uncharacterized protein n=1 Tax=Colletotrichum tamarilloi TaxID=1209934 RepID=A0ABQ9QQN9_9PEZI|nr:uncharacterized protein CTAM01_13915 [Colletotrichum tamarilloi]KAK1481667.1 hypothetical protein CTAM01_13915 [Colletotrichum tamarilloi]
MIGGILRPKSTSSSTLAPASSPDPLFPCHTCLLLFSVYHQHHHHHQSPLQQCQTATLRPRLSLVLGVAFPPPPPSNTTGQCSIVQSNHAHCRINSKAQSLACWISRHALHALRMPHSVTQSPSSNNHHCQTATTRRPPIGPANGPRLMSPRRPSPTSPSVSIVGCLPTQRHAILPLTTLILCNPHMSALIQGPDYYGSRLTSQLEARL